MGEPRSSKRCDTTCRDACVLTVFCRTSQRTATFASEDGIGGGGGGGGPGGELHVPVPAPDEQWACTTSFFAVPKHGSPNVVVLGKILHCDLPRHDASTTLVLLAALQLPVVHLPQMLSNDLGVP